MSSDLNLKRRRVLLGGAGALAALTSLQQALAATVRPTAQITADGIPAFEHHTLGSGEGAPALNFLGWHPLRPEMLVLTQRGESKQLHRVSAAGAKPEALTRGRDGVNDARWEPEAGEFLVFSRDSGGDEAYQLFRLDPVQGEAQALTPAGERVSDFEFLPRGQGLVYLQEQLNREGAAVEEGGAKPASRSRLWWVDPQRPSQRRLLSELRGGRYTDLRVSPAGRIVATATKGGKSQALLFKLEDGSSQPLGAARSEDHDLELDDADTATATRSEEDLLWSRQAVHGEFRHLVRIDAATGERSNLLTDVPADLEALAVARDGQSLALVYNVDGVSTLMLQDGQAKSAPRRIAPALAAGVLRNPKWHPRRPLLGFDLVSSDSPGQLFVWSLEDDKLSAWSAAASGTRLKADVVRWTSFDGLKLSGLHIAPPAHFNGKRPVYISIHGGPASQARPGYVAGVNRALAEQLGMHIIEPNVRGSDGFGKTFLKMDNGRLRENSVRDISALIDFIATQPDMDASRIVVAGGSYGGYMSLAVATHESARILGSICRVGIANFVSFLEHTELYRRDNRRNEYGDERDPSMRSFLQDISPLSHADAVKKPLFVVHGRNDPRVPYGEAEAMVRAVRANGTPVWFLTAQDEGHKFGKSDNRSYLSQVTLEFVQRLLDGKSMQ